MSTLEEHELIATLSASAPATLWLARKPDGDLAELLAVEPLRDDVDEAFFRGDVMPAWARLTALGDARLPMLAGPAFRADGRNVVPFEHRPCIPMADVVKRAALDRGLALPLVVAVGRDLLEAVHAMHQAGVVHGDLRPSATAAGVGGARILVAELARIPRYRDVFAMPDMELDYVSPEAQVHGTLSPVSDVYSVGELLAVLAGADERDDLPGAFIDLVERMADFDAPRRPTVVEALQALARDLAWAQWTKEQAAAELRALFPELESAR